MLRGGVIVSWRTHANYVNAIILCWNVDIMLLELMNADKGVGNSSFYVFGAVTFLLKNIYIYGKIYVCAAKQPKLQRHPHIQNIIQYK